MTIEELLKNIKTKVQETVNADSSKEQIDKVNDICSDIDEVGKTHQNTLTELHDIKDAYIKSIRTSGSSDKPKEPNEPEKPKTLEEIVSGLQQEKK